MSKNILDDLVASEIEARDFGFDWPNREMIVEWAISECHEILAAIQDGESSVRIQEEIGDLFHATISMCQFSGFDVEETLQNAHNKFAKRLHALKEISRRKGLDNLSGKSIEFMLELWNEAKKATA